MNSDEKIFPWLLAHFSEFFAGGQFKENLKRTTDEAYERYEFLKMRTCRNYSIGNFHPPLPYNLILFCFLIRGGYCPPFL